MSTPHDNVPSKGLYGNVPARGLYEDLGIDDPASATPESIRAAYRARAFECHPDRNVGDGTAPARFAIVRRAYAVLSDPQRRRRYDETGDAGPDNGPPPDNTRAQAVGLLGEAYAQLLAEMLEAGSEPRYVNLLDSMRGYLAHQRAETRKVRSIVIKAMALTEDVMRRLPDPSPARHDSSTNGIPAETGADNSTLRRVMEDQQEMRRQALLGIEQKLRVIDDAGELLRGCHYHAEKPPPRPTAGWAIFAVRTSTSSDTSLGGW